MTHPVETLKLGGKAAILATLMATASFAQTATTEAPAGMTTMEEVDFPTLTTVETDEAVAAEIVAQGYENVVVVRTDEALTVAAERGGVPTEMVFSPVDGTLMMVDGVEPMGQAPATGTDMVDTTASTDGDEPMSETPQSTDFSGQDDVVLDEPTGSIDGEETDPVAETIPAESTVPMTGETGQDEDGGAETDGTSDNEDVEG
ncbi:hypothetical protein [Paracoccus gahaiensis]|nr:hypothetical protein [Paracoccus gahaiensis]